MYLTTAAKLFGISDFRSLERWHGERLVVLEFSAGRTSATPCGRFVVGG